MATLTVGLVAAVGVTGTSASTAQASGASPNFVLASSTAPLQPGAVESNSTIEVASAADEARTLAESAMTASTTVTADITASGLDIGSPVTTVDTTELATSVQQLERAQALPFADLSEVTEDVTAEAASVTEQAAGLRGQLDAAIAVKAAAEAAAAEAARLAAEAAAAAAAAAAAVEESSPAAAPANPVYATGGAVGGSSPADAQATARSMLGGYGWGDDQFGCLVSLWQKESGWNYKAHNPSSGAYGIPQALPGSKMASAGADWQTNAATQIAWGFGYISGRYGTPCGAWGQSQSVGWY
ncbi:MULTISPECIES: lytic transglycosylase domain-containing protein [unclassified Microbacterium]|uniref:aggregation-promoting factor C-terminal-like domain-containing protein n=1 Tax=unclassified Microbacterium TaxID=2609290 RepID=UPI00214C389B|nr:MULTISPECIES: lytic transglycosylase domain-containing protein [unclassified Microbacterium]MCR2783933.1 lytic transglycosylase domain-containing protein [Microbacterium sp. zg.B96]WIM15223.1 lytic transglycosylase domain-containing protein [Microbacterium sp. zg-B96]